MLVHSNAMSTADKITNKRPATSHMNACVFKVSFQLAFFTCMWKATGRVLHCLQLDEDLPTDDTSAHILLIFLPNFSLLGLRPKLMEEFAHVHAECQQSCSLLFQETKSAIW